MKFDQIKLYRAIDEILWNDWDPIGINNNGPRDEYQGYIPPIFNLILADADLETIAKKLDQIAVERLGMESNIEHCRKVARKLINIKTE